MQSTITIEQLQYLLQQHTTAQIAEQLQISVPKLRKILKEFGFTYSRKQWTYVERVEDYALTEEEMLFFQQPISSVETYAEPFQLQPELVQQLQVICDKNNILLEQFVEEILLEAIQQLERDDSISL